MTPISIPISELKPAMIGFSKIIRKPSLPILDTIRIERDDDGWITLCASDLAQSATLRLESPEDCEPVTCLVSYPELLKLAKNGAPGEHILVEMPAAQKVLLRYRLGTQSATISLDWFDPWEFPETPEFEDQPERLDSKARESILEAMQCVSSDTERYVLNGVCLDVSEEKSHYVVATDGRQLYSGNSIRLPFLDPVILPKSKFLGWRTFIGDGEWQLRCQPLNKGGVRNLELKSRRWTYVTRLIDGNYPNWRQIIPTEYKTKVILSPAALETALRLIPRIPGDDEADRPITIEIRDLMLFLRGSVQAEEVSPGLEIAGAQISGPSNQVRLNRNYLARALQMGMNELYLTDEKSPLRFVQGGRQLVVMNLPPTEKLAPSGAVQNVEISKPVETNPTERKVAVINNTESISTNSEPPTAQEPASPIEQALELSDSLRSCLQEGMNRLRDLSASLKQMQKDQKTVTKEISQFRSRLKELQSLVI